MRADPTCPSRCRVRSLRSLLLPVILLSACAESDSMPVALDLGPAQWSIEAEPSFEIVSTADDTLELLMEPVAAFRDGDSMIVVADRGHVGVRWFDRNGQLVRQVGRSGAGPGEFGYIAGMLRCGSRFRIQTIRPNTAQWWTLAGRFLQTVVPGAPEGANFGSPYATACSSSGQTVNAGWEQTRGLELGRQRPNVPYWLADTLGTPTHVLGNFPGSERLVGQMGTGPHPMGKEPALAFGREITYLGASDSFYIRRFTTIGDSLEPISLPGLDLTATAEDHTHFRLLDTAGRPAAHIRQAVQMWEESPLPPTIPPFTRMIVDRDDRLWVRLFPRPPGLTVRWLVFDNAGEVVGSVDLPAALEVHDIGRVWVLGLEPRFEDAALRVREYRVSIN